MVKEIVAEPLHEEPKKTPTLKEIVGVLLNPQPKPNEEAKVAEYTNIIHRLLGNNRITRVDIVILVKEFQEPCEAGDTELGKKFPEVIPKRPIAEAWKIVTDKRGLLIAFIRERGGAIPPDEKESIMTMRMFETALFWDEKKSKFGYFLYKYLPGLKEIRRASNLGSCVDADGLFYSESSQSGDSERGTGISTRKIADPHIVEKIMADSEALGNSQEIRSWLNGALTKLNERAEKILRMRYGVSFPVEAELPRKEDWVNHPATMVRVRNIEADTLKAFRERGLPTDSRNPAAIAAANARAKRLKQGVC